MSVVDLLARIQAVRPRPPDALWVLLGGGLIVAGLVLGLGYGRRVRDDRLRRRVALEAVVTVLVGVGFIVGGLA